MERMGDILAKVAGRRTATQSKTRRASVARKTTGASGAQKTHPAPTSHERLTEGQMDTKTPARPSAQMSAPVRQTQPVRRPATQSLPDAIESPLHVAPHQAIATPDAEPILEMPTRRRTTTAPASAPIGEGAYAAGYAPGASLRLSSAALRAPVTTAPLPARHSSAEAAPTTAPIPETRVTRRTLASRVGASASPAGAQAGDTPTQAGVARTRSNGRPPAAGMLPLGAAARGYLDAVSARRGQQPAQAANVAIGSQQQQHAASRQNAPEAVAQPVAYGAPEEDVCLICGGMGYVRMDVPVGDPMFGQAAPCECKERQREEHRRRDLRRISSLDAFDKKTFETFDYRAAPAARDAIEIARRYADDPQGWLILSGGYGVGKTHLAAAIANHQLSRGAHVFFSIVPDLLDHLRAAFAPSSESPFDEMFDRVREAGLLVLDDLGAENSTAWATEKLFQLVNYRYNYRMPTVITTNHRLLSHIDERINSRLSDLSLARHVVIEAPDYRQRHAGRPAPTRGRTGPRG